MKAYTIKVALRGVSPMVWRRFSVTADMSLACLHYIIQIAQGWNDEYLHQFHIYGKDYGIAYEGGISFSDDPYQVVLDDFGFDVGARFTYEYDFFENWLHDIRIEAIHDNSNQKSPFCLNGHREVRESGASRRGMPGATLTDEIDKTIALLQTVNKADESTTAGDVRDFIEALDTVRFNRNKINHQLSKLNLALPVLEPEVIRL
ncbi:MAG: plasmid pRiA4b ORF-3 family protein (plasmid) [Candidatus Symbiodolus clandestinus]